MSWTDTVFRPKIRCKACGDIIIPGDDPKEWTMCLCEKVGVMGKGRAYSVKGKDYDDLSYIDFDKVPEHKGWDDKNKEKGN
jgi:hypothetical protein